MYYALLWASSSSSCVLLLVLALSLALAQSSQIKDVADLLLIWLGGFPQLCVLFCKSGIGTHT